MRIAILDLGTNTFHLLIADTSRKGMHAVFRSRRTVKLGEGGFPGGAIGPEPWERGLRVLCAYSDIILHHYVKVVRAYATSAIRSAVNGKAFAREVYRKAGIRISILSGKREAELIYHGVRYCIPASTQPGYDLVMDIGGGSVEFILGDAKGIAWKQSFDTGAARLLERFRFSDPARPAEVKKAEDYLRRKWNPLFEATCRFPVRRLIGSSGSFESLSAMIGWRLRGRASYAVREKFKLAEVERQHKILFASTHRQRLRTKGLIRMRVDMILPASICTQVILGRLNIAEMYLSRYALKEGALFEEMKNYK